MSRDPLRRLQNLEKAQGVRLTFDSLASIARDVRSGGQMPDEWANLFTPDQLCRMADEQERDDLALSD